MTERINHYGARVRQLMNRFSDQSLVDEKREHVQVVPARNHRTISRDEFLNRKAVFTGQEHAGLREPCSFVRSLQQRFDSVSCISGTLPPHDVRKSRQVMAIYNEVLDFVDRHMDEDDLNQHNEMIQLELASAANITGDGTVDLPVLLQAQAICRCSESTPRSRVETLVRLLQDNDDVESILSEDSGIASDIEHSEDECLLPEAVNHAGRNTINNDVEPDMAGERHHQKPVRRSVAQATLSLDYSRLEKQNRLSGELWPKEEWIDEPLNYPDTLVTIVEEEDDYHGTPRQEAVMGNLYNFNLNAIQNCLKAGEVDVFEVLLFGVDTAKKMLHLVYSNTLDHILSMRKQERSAALKALHSCVGELMINEPDQASKLQAFFDKIDGLIPTSR